jgi:hypothetical protein
VVIFLVINVVIAKHVRGGICVKSDGNTGLLLTSDYLGLGLIFAFIVSVKSEVIYAALCILKKDLREIGWGGIDWIDLAQDRDQ